MLLLVITSCIIYHRAVRGGGLRGGSLSYAHGRRKRKSGPEFVAVASSENT